MEDYESRNDRRAGLNRCGEGRDRRASEDFSEFYCSSSLEIAVDYFDKVEHAHTRALRRVLRRESRGISRGASQGGEGKRDHET